MIRLVQVVHLYVCCKNDVRMYKRGKNKFKEMGIKGMHEVHSTGLKVNTHLCRRILSKWNTFLSKSRSGRKPSQATLNTTGSGFSRMQQTTASS